MKNGGPATQGVCPVAVKNAPWLDAFFVKMDDFFGYGKQVKASEFWAE